MSTIINSRPFKLKLRSKSLERIVFSVLKVPSTLWYQKLKSSKHFDEIILQRIFIYEFKSILPNHSAMYYDKNIISSRPPYNKKKPDFLLWKNDFSEWYVIEIELKNHSIKHINDQLEAFYYGDYSDTQSIFDYVRRSFPTLDETRFKSMISSNRPKILLMADHIECEWRDQFYKDYQCQFSTLQVYTDQKDHFLYRISGDFPQEYSTFTFGNLDKRIQALNLDGLNFLSNKGYVDQQTLEIFVQGEPDDWLYTTDRGKEILIYQGGGLSPLDQTRNTWKLIVNNKNQLHLIK